MHKAETPKDKKDEVIDIINAPKGVTTEQPDVTDISPQIIPKQNNFRIFG